MSKNSFYCLPIWRKGLHSFLAYTFTRNCTKAINNSIIIVIIVVVVTLLHVSRVTHDINFRSLITQWPSVTVHNTGVSLHVLILTRQWVGSFKFSNRSLHERLDQQFNVPAHRRCGERKDQVGD